MEYPYPAKSWKWMVDEMTPNTVVKPFHFEGNRTAVALRTPSDPKGSSGIGCYRVSGFHSKARS